MVVIGELINQTNLYEPTHLSPKEIKGMQAVYDDLQHHEQQQIIMALNGAPKALLRITEEGQKHFKAVIAINKEKANEPMFAKALFYNFIASTDIENDEAQKNVYELFKHNHSRTVHSELFRHATALVKWQTLSRTLSDKIPKLLDKTADDILSTSDLEIKKSILFYAQEEMKEYYSKKEIGLSSIDNIILTKTINGDPQACAQAVILSNKIFSNITGFNRKEYIKATPKERDQFNASSGYAFLIALAAASNNNLNGFVLVSNAYKKGFCRINAKNLAVQNSLKSDLWRIIAFQQSDGASSSSEASLKNVLSGILMVSKLLKSSEQGEKVNIADRTLHALHASALEATNSILPEVEEILFVINNRSNNISKIN
ncbi:MAG: hypothetical protein GY804_14240 [Alphaproteobacteria bacterium]|nr:hypothetical protein [Alphaproteobacteria bacterium]